MAPCATAARFPNSVCRCGARARVDMNVPIACGGVAVYPGDIVVADVDGVVIVPREMAEDVARDATEQEQLEIFISQRIDEGRPLRGTYPPNEETLAAYAQWRAQKQS
jgi:regulator of RNase E activity RraA